jgi:hypothetical protein
MTKWKLPLIAVVVSAGLCDRSHGFEWLDRLIGIDLDNSEAASPYQPYSTGYAPYGAYGSGYQGNIWYSQAPANGYGYTPQTGYRTNYQPAHTTYYQPTTTCDPYGNRATTMRPEVTYPVQNPAVPYVPAQPTYSYPPPTRYAPARGW